MKTLLTRLEQCIQIVDTLSDKELMQLLEKISARIQQKNKQLEPGKVKSNN